MLLCPPFPEVREGISKVIRATSAMADSIGLVVAKRSKAIYFASRR